MSQLELQLPYEEITSLANRDYMRANFKPGPKVSYFIPFKDILIREGFNQRIQYEEIEELAESIDKHKLQEPFVLDILLDGRAMLERGHRRHMAFQLLIEQGKFDPSERVEFFPNRIIDKVTEEMRMVNQYIINNLQKPLKPLERAAVAYSLKHNFGQERTNEEVGKLMTLARQTVDNLIAIHEADDHIKQSIMHGDMSVKEALSFITSQRKAQKQADKKEEESHKNTASPTPLPVDINAKELAELKELEETQVEENGDDGETLVTDSEDEVRISTYNPDAPHETKPLDLVGNTIASNGKEEKPENDKAIKYDELRPEIAQVQNCIKLNDKIGVRIEKLDISDQDKKDLTDWLKWQMNDLEPLRDWVHTNKKQNKKDR